MAELVLGATLLSSTAGASTVGLLGAGGVFAPAAGTLFGSIGLGTALTAASAFGSIMSGKQQSDALKIQARQSSLNARTERLEGRRKSLEIKEQLDKDLASQNALFAARGVLQGEGSAGAAQAVAKSNASKDIDYARFNTDINALSSEQSAANAKSDASASMKQGVFDAFSTLSTYKRKPSLAG